MLIIGYYDGIGNKFSYSVRLSAICLKNSFKYCSAEMPCILHVNIIVWYAAEIHAIFPAFEEL